MAVKMESQPLYEENVAKEPVVEIGMFFAICKSIYELDKLGEIKRSLGSRYGMSALIGRAWKDKFDDGWTIVNDELLPVSSVLDDNCETGLDCGDLFEKSVGKITEIKFANLDELMESEIYNECLLSGKGIQGQYVLIQVDIGNQKTSYEVRDRYDGSVFKLVIDKRNGNGSRKEVVMTQVTTAVSAKV